MTTGHAPASASKSQQLNTTCVVNATYLAYRQSFAWIVLFWAVAMITCVGVHDYYVDFVHHSPLRARENALAAMKLMPPFIGVIAVIGAFLVFTLPQILQAKVADLSLSYGRRPALDVLLALPLTTVIAWYSYHYLTPSNMSFMAAHLYQHGLTLKRYAAMFAIQTPITLFCICYHHAVLRRTRKAWFVLVVLSAVIGAGGIRGYEMANAQTHFFKTK